jgi:hypothetical protein
VPILITTYIRPYLINPVTLHIVTVQNKAWNDSAGMLIHIELQLAPYKVKFFVVLPCLMAVDNSGCHKVGELVLAFQTVGWILKFFPPNMTGALQPMDLVVNSVCKKSLRHLRTVRVPTCDKLDALVAAANKEDLPPFNPPVPKTASRLRLELMENEFSRSLSSRTLSPSAL